MNIEYYGNTECIFRFKKVGGASVYYRVFHSAYHSEGFFLLLSSKLGGRVEDFFVPHIFGTLCQAQKLLDFLYENSVTPCTAEEIIDEYLGNL